ncbi:MAG: tRNA epoxyqueuosine(34) reductase QueG [Chlamydiota bacterium]|nr:tRNA epoxyqueuosine(34) reductase QueG [Chlamydiota bacterium]
MDITLAEIREKALNLGWDDVGITDAIIPEEDIKAYREWLSENYHGNLGYMENELRCSPQQLLPDAKSAIIFLSYYKQEKQEFTDSAGVIASYARGRDYHNVHRRRLKKFIRWLEEKSGQTDIAKGFSDSTPVLEKALAVQAGLGWFGKNTLLIHRKYGTFTLLAGVFTSLKLPVTTTKNLRLPKCGSCTRCLDACPTKAITAPYKLDARKCLSYHLIESKKEIPEKIRNENPGYVFGCDICQDACPHNLRKPLSLSPDFSPEKGIGSYIDENKLSNILKNPESLFGTPLNRRGQEGLDYNFSLLKKNEN